MSAIASKIVGVADAANLSCNVPSTSTEVERAAPREGCALARLLTAGEVATVLRVHPNRVYELAARRVLPAVRVGRLLRFNLGVLQQWIESGGTETADAPSGRAST